MDHLGRLNINCNGEGVLFVEDASDFTLDNSSEFTPSSSSIFKNNKCIIHVMCGGIWSFQDEYLVGKIH